ncbi:MAG: HEAT repeat domain-containing protein [Jaaginema sp. PMC 1079.18]|nr:HEAT repeat domain-containing protein [Jaaginema sp. PMC 1080.18]MEC4851286.1 HEAT repeat domain-containing protein [Jaaginema sp. PMC 1079.18]MEC4865496.1 HEAT repeat domain-containing protein [Jaaginema sp. PMC 1078.18]
MSVTPESVQTLLDSADYGDRLSGVNQLRDLEPALAFNMVLPLINDPHARVRYSAISLMDTLGGEDLAKSQELLRDRLLRDSESDVKAAAADALAALKLSDTYDDLKNAYYESDDWLLQMSIVAAIGVMGCPQAFDLLVDAVQSDNLLIQTAAVGAFGDLGDARAISLLTPLVTHPDWQSRYRVAQTLNRLGGEEAKAALATLAQDEVEQIAQEAQKNL